MPEQDENAVFIIPLIPLGAGAAAQDPRRQGSFHKRLAVILLHATFYVTLSCIS